MCMYVTFFVQSLCNNFELLCVACCAYGYAVQLEEIFRQRAVLRGIRGEHIYKADVVVGTLVNNKK